MAEEPTLTPKEKMRELVVWLEFLKRALANPSGEGGMEQVFRTSVSADVKMSIPERPRLGCGGKEGLTNVDLTLREVVECVGDLHVLAVDVEEHCA